MQFASLILAIMASMLGFANAQNSSYPYAVDPGTVQPSMRIAWCSSQRSSCNSICANNAPTNNCDATSLVYSCTCANGQTPNITQYNNTVPWYECQQYVSTCITSNTMNATAQQQCEMIQCGGKDPSMAAVTSTSSSSSMTTMSATGAPTSAAPSSASSSASHSNIAPSSVKIDSTFGTVMFVLAGGLMLGGLAL